MVKSTSYTIGEKAYVLERLEAFNSVHPDKSLADQIDGSGVTDINAQTIKLWVRDKDFILAAKACGYFDKTRISAADREIVFDKMKGDASESSEEEESEEEILQSEGDDDNDEELIDDTGAEEESESDYDDSSSSLWPVALYIPNLLGYLRIILSFVGMNYALQNHQASALNVWIVAALLDMVDGISARTLNQCSKFGVLLDIIADNMLRTIVWISSVINIASSTSANDTWLHIGIISVIAIEWTTMYCTQANNIFHWKDMLLDDANVLVVESPPFWVRAVFRNNFRTPIGLFAIYGLFVAPLGTYIRYADPTLKTTWWLTNLLSEQMVSNLIMLSYLGRFLTVMVELWLCNEYLSGVIARDYASKQFAKEKDS